MIIGLVTYKPEHDNSDCRINRQRDGGPYLKSHSSVRVRARYAGATHNGKRKPQTCEWCRSHNNHYNQVCHDTLDDEVVYGAICDFWTCVPSQGTTRHISIRRGPEGDRYT